MRNYVFLVRASNGRECVARLPVNRSGGLAQPAFKIIREKLYDASSASSQHIAYALNLEAFNNGKELAEAIESYKQDVV